MLQRKSFIDWLRSNPIKKSINDILNGNDKEEKRNNNS